MKRFVLGLWVLAAVCAGGCEACKDFFDSGDDPESMYGYGNGVGEACAVNRNCRTGLICYDGTCQPSGTTPEGNPCTLTGECAEGLYCSSARTCAPAGTGADGDSCESTGDCTAGLVCAVEGFFAVCRPGGSGDLGASCTLPTDCMAGLVCVMGFEAGTCTSPMPMGGGDGGVPATPPSIPYWPGVECAEPSGAPRALFDVPRAGVTQDFYSLPYPNDARRTATGLDLSGHPSPGTVLPVDIIDRYLRASETDLDGFSTNPTIYFRFSHSYDWDSVGGQLRFVDITPGSPTYGAETGLGWFTTSGQITKYICPNWLAYHPPHGAPLRPGTTYAAIVGTGVRPTMDVGTSFARSPDFEAMLGAAAPSDPALAAAYDRYAPLRAYIADSTLDPATILVASVFTTQSVESRMPKLREVIRAAPVPTVTDLTVCDGTTTSPCDDGTEQRACGTMNPAFVEIHGRIALPIFQEGTPPYENPDDGGGIVLDGLGAPVIQRTENVCFALTVPRGVTPPAEGFPLLVVAHGTGGSFTNAIGSGLAQAAAMGDAGGTTVNAATLTIDLPQHGARRGMSTRSPELLFFNFVNPRAARDNITQGSADLMSLAFFAEGFALDAMASPTGMPIAFDETKLVLLAHSQGATHASLMIPFETAYSAVVLSGNGGDLTMSLLTKTEPVNISALLPLALLDPTDRGTLVAGDFHPALALFQGYFDAVDPVNYARRLRADPPMGWPGVHVFATYGPRDSYSTVETLRSYARAAGFVQVNPIVDPDVGLPAVDGPLAGNAVVGMNMRTIGMRQYDTEAGHDGHFVAFEHPLGIADVQRFLLMALAGQVPAIGGP